MFYSKFTIANYRGFQDEQILEIAIPEDSSPGSGITYIVGENNTGKTTVIEGLFLRGGDAIRTSEKQSSNPVFNLYSADNTEEGLVRQVTLMREGAYRLEQKGVSDSFEIVPSRRHWIAKVQQYGHSLEEITSESEILKQDVRSLEDRSPVMLSEILKEIESDDKKHQKFIKLVQEVFPEFSSFAVGYEDHEYIEYTTNDGVKHKSDFLGDGVISVLRILAHLYGNKLQPLVIDEPELSLHPLAQKRLLEVMAEYAQKRQIILSTHSPYFVSWEYIKNGASLNKVTKYEDKKSEIHTLQPYENYEKLVGGANWQQPFLMDVVAKEIFFSDDFLFVEGQEDVGLLKKEECLGGDVNIFGYGVRGHGMLKFALQLARDVGVRKAAAILDAGEEESKTKASLKEMFPDYKIIQWDKEDIRDKEPHTSEKKEGYFDAKGVKKNTDSDDFDAKIEEINQYFNPTQ